MCTIPEKVTVPPRLPTSPLPSRRNVPAAAPLPTVRQPRRTLRPKPAVKVLVTSGVLLVMMIGVVVMSLMLGRNTGGTNHH